MSYPDPHLQEQARQALAQQNFPLAVNLLSRAVAANPNDVGALALLGMACSQAGQHAAARQHLTAAVQRMPQNAGFRYQLGMALERAGDLPGALRAYQETVRVNPSFLEAQKRVNALRAQPSPVQPPAPNPYASQPAIRPPAGPPTPPVQSARGISTPATPVQNASMAPVPGYIHQPVPGYVPAVPPGIPLALRDAKTPDMDATEALLRRAGAWLLDWMLLMVAGWLIIFLGGAMIVAGVSMNPHSDAATALGSVGLFLLIWIVPILLVTAYLAGMHHTRGQTLGKMALGIRVMRADGGRISLGQAVFRDTIGRWVSALFCALGFFWMLWDPDQQTWADKMASTYVRRA